MLTGIRERTVVQKNGKIEISVPDVLEGTEVEVTVLLEEQDATEYLLSTEANREHMEHALEELKHPENFIYINIEDYEKGGSPS